MPSSKTKTTIQADYKFRKRDIIKHASPFSKAHILIVILAFALIGGYVLYKSFAAGGLADGNTQTLTNKGSSKCLDITGQSTLSTANAVQITCDSTSTSQKWLSQAATTAGYFTLKPQHSNLCLDVLGQGTADFTQIEQYTCNGGTNQQWQVLAGADAGYVILKDLNSGKCAGINTSFAAEGAPVQLYTCNSSVGSQEWLINVTSSGGVSGSQVGIPGIGIRDWTGTYTPAQLARYGTVITDGSYTTGTSKIAQTKAISPNTKFLDYVSAASMEGCGNTFPQDTCGTGVSQEDNSAAGNAWTLYDSSNRVIVNRCYSYNQIGDVGSLSFQQKWVQNAAGRLQRLGYDGVWMDDVVGGIGGFTGALNGSGGTGCSSADSAYPAKYPNDAAWIAAMKSFMDYVGPHLKAQGFYVASNAFNYGANDGSDDLSFWQSLAPDVNALNSEYWEQVSSTDQTFDNSHCCWYSFWDGWLRLMDSSVNGGAQGFGYEWLPNATGPNIRRDRIYGRASYLMKWDGGSGVYLVTYGDNADPWNADWTADLGAPTGAMTQVSTNVYKRSFTKGMAIVNANCTSVTNPFCTNTPAVNVNLGAVYTNTLDSSSVSSLSVPANSGALLISQTAANVPGDVNSDGHVTITDLSILLSHYGQSGQSPATGDCNNDGSVTIFDLSIVLSHYGQ